MKVGNGHNNLWFGTEERMDWMPTPLQGADMSPESAGTGGTTLNGGGYERHAWASHKTFVFEWRDSSAVEAAALMSAYRDGAYGRGLLYFLDPLLYKKNLASVTWGHPAIVCGDEGPSHVYGITPDQVGNSGWEANNLPIYAAYYDLGDTDSGYRGTRDSLFIPIPTGYTAYVGAFHSTTGDGVIEAYPVASNGSIGSPTALTEVANSATNIVPDDFSGGRGIRIQVGTSGTGGTVTFAALVVRMYRTGLTPPASFTSGPWVKGLGHSGVRFSGVPTYIANTGVDDGQVGYAASFREVGSWG